ncbi:MAG: M23 family metallopeptidase [Hyphomonadaceae bacterium]|nr:M23 family metallopeptidase [Hyphomonadaceae bacterium]
MRWALLAAGLFLAACTSPASAAPDPVQTPQVAEAPVVAPQAPPVVAQPSAPPQPSLPAAPPAADVISCTGPATQGGAILCRANPGATLALDGTPTALADSTGLAVIGLRRAQTSPATISFVDPLDQPVSYARRSLKVAVEVLPRTDTVAKLTMECNKIAAQSSEEKRHAEVSWVKKDNALKIFSEPVAPVGLVKPAEGAYSSPFGATRTYVPKTKDCEGSTSVHNGQDIAIGTGTPILAPMGGTVILADPDLYYEGGCVFLDLGYGLVSVTMHMSRIDVKPGDKVSQGQMLGLSGSTGRVTGPHLHWAIKYRNVLSADRGTDIWLDPVLMMSLKTPSVAAP